MLIQDSGWSSQLDCFVFLNVAIIKASRGWVEQREKESVPGEFPCCNALKKTSRRCLIQFSLIVVGYLSLFSGNVELVVVVNCSAAPACGDRWSRQVHVTVCLNIFEQHFLVDKVFICIKLLLFKSVFTFFCLKVDISVIIHLPAEQSRRSTSLIRTR